MTQGPPIAFDDKEAIVPDARRMTRLRIAWLPDGKRLRLSDGLIDIILQAFGRPGDISRAYDAAIDRTRRILNEFDTELPRIGQGPYRGGLLADRVGAAVSVFSEYRVPPSSALAGAVADDVMAAMLETAPLDRVYVNNCGRIAFHLDTGQNFSVDMMDWPGGKCLPGKVRISSQTVARGFAASTRRWDGPVGVAEALMIAAATAAAAGVAGGLIAKATDAPMISNAEQLSDAEKNIALASGVALAKKLQDENLIRAAIVTVQGEEIRLLTDRMKEQFAEA